MNSNERITSGPFEGLMQHGYDFMMSDPPWRFGTYSAKGKEQKSAENHYETMSLEDIMALPVADLAAKHCLLWLWVTRPMFLEGLKTLEAWGFTYKTQGVWVKTAKQPGKLAFGTGYLLRDAHEPFILATRGKPKVASRSVRSVVMGPRREHSRKPEEAYDAAEELAGDMRKLDMFSRQSRPGWDNWGFEKEKFDPSDAINGILGSAA